MTPVVALSTIHKSFTEEEKIEGVLQSLNDSYPIERIGNIEDIANSVEFLLSNKVSWIVDATLDADSILMTDIDQ